jgi:hypothetical protein
LSLIDLVIPELCWDNRFARLFVCPL